MRPCKIQITFLLCVLFSSTGLSQRAHEIQFQFGVSFNRGVSFYNFIEPGDERRHNFEFDQKHNTSFYNLTWFYPVNSYLDMGLFLSHSINSTLHLIEAESILFDSNKPGERGASPLFLGLTRLSTRNREFGLGGKVNMLRFKKFKSYLLLGAGMQKINVVENTSNIIEAEHPDLRRDFLETYMIREHLLTITYGLGISYLLKSGIHLKILELQGKNHPENSLLLSAANTIELRTGISYQFYRRK